MDLILPKYRCFTCDKAHITGWSDAGEEVEQTLAQFRKKVDEFNLK